MRRIILLLAVAALMAASLVVGGPASAQGCSGFGVGFVAGNAPHGELASSLAPLNDEILGLHAAYCE